MTSSPPTTDGPAPASDESVRWLSADEARAWRAYVSGTRRLIARLDQDLKIHGLTHDDYGVLVALSEADGDRLRMAELAERAVESRSRLSHHVGRLESRGLVERAACPEDRRGQLAILTPEGRRLMEVTAPHHVAGVREHFLDKVSAEELATLGAVFARIHAGLGSDAWR